MEETHDTAAIVPAAAMREQTPVGNVIRLFPDEPPRTGLVWEASESELDPPALSGTIVPAPREREHQGDVVPTRPRARHRRTRRPGPQFEGTPLCPADAGLLRYAASVTGHGVVRSPIAVWDRFWDWIKLAPMREGNTHRGLIPERHQQAYVKVQQERARRLGRVGWVLSWPWHTGGKVTPVTIGTWGVTTGEIAYAANPDSPLLAHTVGLVNAALGELLAGVGAIVEPVTLPAAAVAGLAALGQGIKAEHHRRRRLLLVREGAEVGIKEDGELLPAMALEDCPHAATVLEATRRNLAIEKVLVRPLSAQPTSWGWEVVVQLKRGTPADIAAKLAELETLFDVRVNGVLMQPHTDRRARVTLRLIESDPWAEMPELPDYTTGPRSVRDPIHLAQRLDGVQLSSSFAGKQSIILAASGGGKSILLRVVVDGLGAARDVHIWDLDPSGVGQAPQGGLMGKVALSPEDCETALAQALAIAEARTRLLRKLGMGDAWVSSPERPALAVIMDEFPRLTKNAKHMAVALLRVARKAGVALIFATQDPAKGVIGESIAGQVAFKAAGPGTLDWQADLLWGPGCKNAGWTPGRYQPATSADQLGDAGVFFLSGTGTPGGDMALPSKVLYMSGETAKARADRYVALGCCPGLDAETLAWAGLTAEEVYTHTDAESAGSARLVAMSQAPEAEEDAPEVPQEARDLVAALAPVASEFAGEWIPVDVLVDAAARAFGWEPGRATQMRVAALLDAVQVARHRTSRGVCRSRTGLLAAAETGRGGQARTA